MILYINSVNAKDEVKIGLKEGDSFVAERIFEAKYAQGEKLLPAIADMLLANKRQFIDLDKIVVTDSGEGFSALRVGVITANALGFALGIPVVSETGAYVTQKDFSIIAPIYSKEPNINLKGAK